MCTSLGSFQYESARLLGRYRGMLESYRNFTEAENASGFARGPGRDALSAHTASLSSHPQHGPFKLFAEGAKPRHVWKVARSLPC